jgi:dephospho-CoA kinase
MSCLRIGLTGGIASGKSTAAKFFSDLSIPIIDADKIARDLLNKNSPLLDEIKQKFGDKVFLANGELNRKALGKIVFNNTSDLAWLNQLTHPKVNQKIEQELESIDSDYVIIDIPLLIDKSGHISKHLEHLVDRILVVDIALKTQLSRLCERDNIDLKDAEAIIKNQSTREQKLALADDLIDNNGSLSQLESQVFLLHNLYLLFGSQKV